MKFLELLKEKVVVFDGAMGSNLQAQNLTIEDWGGPNFENCSENLLYTKPDAIAQVHIGFLDAGVDVIETNSFGGGEVVLTEFGIADKAYDADVLRQDIAQRGAIAVIPSRANRKAPPSYDRDQYKHRNLIERHFCRIKHFRRIATRYEKLSSRFASFIALVASFVWLT